MLKLKYYLPVLLIFFYIILAAIKLGYPGLQYDEILFGNAALGMLDNSFVYKKINNFPLMLMPYIGALKAHLYYLIFLIFDPSYISIRLPMILLAAISLWLIYKYVMKGAGLTIAVLSLLFLVADSSFITLTRTDVGPVVIGLFFRSLALLYFFKFIENRSSKYLITISVSLLLGFYDKLNFIWFINAFLIAAIIFYPSIFGSIRELFKRKITKIFIGAFLATFIILIILVIQLGIAKELSLIPTQSHISIVYNNFFHLINGSSFYSMVIGDWNRTSALAWIIWAIIICGSILTLKHPKSNAKTFHFFNLFLLVITLIQILLTNQATAPWHTFMLQPTTAILLASSLVFITETVLKQNEIWRQTILTITALIIFGTQVFTYSVYIFSYEKPYRAFIWSKKIDDLHSFSQSVPNRFVSMDWGFHTQLLTLGRQRGKYYELFFDQNDPPKPEMVKQLRTDFFNPDNNYLFLFHGENNTLFKPTRQYFFEIADQLGLQAELVKTFDEDGKVLYEVYRLRRK